jgi:hypothetical protein
LTRGVLASALAVIAGLTLAGTAHASVADAKRGYELVSPPEIGARPVGGLPGTGQWSSPISPDGRVLFSLASPDPSNLDEPIAAMIRAERGAAGWELHRLGVPQATYSHNDNQVGAASADLSTIVASNKGPASLSSENLRPDAVFPDPSAAFDYTWAIRSSGVSWLGQSTVPRDVVGDLPAPPQNGTPALSPVRVSDDGISIVFAVNAALIPEIPPGLGKSQLYRRVGDQPVEAIAKAADGTLATGGANLWGINSDATTVVYSLANGELDVLTPGGVRQANRPRLTTPAPGASLTEASATLTPDGKTVYFRSSDRLVDDDTDTSLDIYRYAVGTDHLALISRGTNGAPGGNADDCSGLLTGVKCDMPPPMVSRDGSTAYFFAPEQLDGTKGTAGVAGLYRADGDGAPQFIADVAAPEYWMPNPTYFHSAWEITSKNDLIFQTANPVASGQTGGRQQVWRYSRASGVSSCLTCRRSGGNPLGQSSLAIDNGPGASLGTAPFNNVPTADFTQRSTADGDTVFVNSYDQLTPEDKNVANDVYAIDLKTGTPHLVTTGTADLDSYLAGTDATGMNVFFFTADSLDPHDHNGLSAKLYDARVGGGFPATPADDVCAPGGCRAITPLPLGAGNLTQSTPPDTTPHGDDPQVSITVPSASARARLASTGRLRVSLTGLTAGAVAALRVKVTLGATVRGKRTVSAAALSTAGGTSRTITVRFSPADRKRIANASRRRTLRVALQLDAGADARAVETSSISRSKKGN